METKSPNGWNAKTGAIYKNVLLFTVAGALASFFSMIPLCGWISDMAGVVLIAGFTAFYVRIKDLTSIADEKDRGALKNLSLGVILFLIGRMLRLIPIAGWIVGPLVTIAAFVFMLLAYNALKSSATFPNAEGMKTLSLSLIIGIVGVIVGIIPLIGIIGKILVLVAYIMMILGWKKVAAPVAE